MARLEQELSRLKQGDHLCSIYESTAEQLAVAVPFIIGGFARGERCVYITDDRTIEEVVLALTAAGVDVVQERQRGALRLLTRDDMYRRAGEFLPLAMIDFVRHAEAEALADGFSGLRLTGEMTWVLLPEHGCSRLIEYEALLNQLPANSKSVILCQYNRSRLDAPCIHDVFRTHPLAVLGDQICGNPYYEPPEMVLTHGQIANSDFAAKRVDWWISQLKRAHIAEQEREQLMNRLKSLSRRLLEVQEEERLHLARELHDEFGQVLAAITLHLHAIAAPGWRGRPAAAG
jgi:signal transduction histidine kinase